jgi:hypothetical protein
MKQGLVQATTAFAAAPIDHPGSERIWHATYVLYERIFDYLACGWMVALPNAPMHHHTYGAVLEWRCECKMPRPR